MKEQNPDLNSKREKTRAGEREMIVIDGEEKIKRKTKAEKNTEESQKQYMISGSLCPISCSDIKNLKRAAAPYKMNYNKVWA